MGVVGFLPAKAAEIYAAFSSLGNSPREFKDRGRGPEKST